MYNNNKFISASSSLTITIIILTCAHKIKPLPPAGRELEPLIGTLDQN